VSKLTEMGFGPQEPPNDPRIFRGRVKDFFIRPLDEPCPHVGFHADESGFSAWGRSKGLCPECQSTQPSGEGDES